MGLRGVRGFFAVDASSTKERVCFTMTKVYSFTCSLDADIVDVFCLLQKGFTDQFVYYDKERPNRYMGLGRCIALPSLDNAEYELEGSFAQPPVFFSFNRFDAENPAPTDELFEAFPRLKFMLPEVVLIESERGATLQVNSLSPVYAGRVARFLKQARQAPKRTHASIPFSLEPDSREVWAAAVNEALSAIDETRQFFASLGMPTTLAELGVSESDIPRMLPTLRDNKGEIFGSFKKLSAEDARAIYLLAL